MNGGTEKNQAGKAWPKKIPGRPEYSKVAHVQTSQFQKEIIILKTDHERSKEQDFP